MIQEPQKVAIPAVLRQGLVAFREVSGNQQKYRIQDNWKGLTYQFESWQFFILEVLPVCNDFRKLTSIFEDRFGRSITKEEVERLFTLVSDTKLFGSAAEAHPLLAGFVKKKEIMIATPPMGPSQAIPAGNKGDGIKGKGNGSGNGGDASPGTLSSERKEISPGKIETGDIVSNTADFSLDEFKKQNKDIEKICRSIKKDYELGAIKAPENTIEWLNEALQIPDLLDKTAPKRPTLALTKDIEKLKKQTEKIRKASFKDLKIGEQNAIRMMNRLLLELVYPDTPKGTVPVDPEKDNRIFMNLFDPTYLLKAMQPYISPLKYAMYLLPAPVIAAFFIALNNADLIQEDLKRISDALTFASHLLIGMFTVNLAATAVSALVAYSYRASVKSFGVVLHFGFFPRFMVQMSNTEQLSRSERIWLHAAPLIARTVIAALGILLWYGTRTSNGLLPQFALTVGFIAAASLIIAANPLMKSNGSHLLGAVLNEPQLRGKAYFTLINKLRGNVYQKSDNNILAAYALVSSVFIISVFTFFLVIFGGYLKMHLGGAGALLVALVLVMLLMRFAEKIKQMGAAYDRGVQFERWKNRALPTVDTAPAETKRWSMSPAKWFVASLVAAAFVVPYHYEPGGNFVLLPNQKAELNSENGAIIKKVYYNGGEYLPKGTVVAELSSADYQGQMQIHDAKVREQKAVLDDLKSRPRPEETRVAKRAFEVQQERARFSGDKLNRLERLYQEKTISFEEIYDQRRLHEVDLAQVKESRAKLELVEAGATDEQIIAAEAKMQSFIEERDYYKEKINQSFIIMPFDGTLEGINLKLKTGHYLNKGEVFAVAENTSQVFAEIEVPEPDIRYVAQSERIRVRPVTYSGVDMTGVVLGIDPGVTEKRYGKVVKVLTRLDNEAGHLKSGMTGYAKISSKNMPLGKVMTLAIIRFFEVEVWSWIP